MHIDTLSRPTAGCSSPVLIEPALEALLNQSAVRVEVIAELQHCGSWYHNQPRYACGLFHLVGAGQCRIQTQDVDVLLEAGDLVVLPHGDAHRLCTDAPNTVTPERTSLICGELRFAGNTPHPLNHALPSCFVVRSRDAGHTFAQLSQMMVDVVNSRLGGRQLLLNKLADTLFTLAICDYARRADDRRGLFAALTDTRICKVLQAVHDKPGHAWTMQAMASLACMSRSAFAERFTQLVKVPPMQYVTQWRVTIAEQMLRERQLSVASIAQRLGYSSEAAFRRLFKRVSGISPGRIRAEGVAADDGDLESDTLANVA